jgi:hypothetical protein
MAIEGHQHDLRANSPVLKKALAMTLRKGRRMEISESDITLRVFPIDETDVRVECNLSVFGIAMEGQHKIVELALLANGGLNSQIVEMRNHETLSGAIDDELPLFAGKFDFLAASLSPGSHDAARQTL